VKTILLSFFLSRIFFVIAAYISSLVIPLNEGYVGRQFSPDSHFLFWAWANFDGRHFLNIASTGYQNFDFAYFPLYPLLISFFSTTALHDFLVSGIAINLVALIISLIVVYKIILLDYPKKIARLAIVLLCFFPLSFFYNSVYADALFLMLSSLSFYFARKKNWFLSSVFLSLTICTRLSGVVLSAGIAWELVFGKAIASNDIKANFFRWCFQSLILAFLGLLPYLGYLQIVHGDWLLFQKSMVAWGQNSLVFLPQVIYRYFKILTTVNTHLLVYWVAVFELLTFIAYMALSIYVWKKVRQSYAVFMVLLLIMVTFTGTLAGTPRYMLHLFPGFIGMAVILNSRPSIKIAVLSLFLFTGIILTSLFTRGFFIA